MIQRLIDFYKAYAPKDDADIGHIWQYITSTCQLPLIDALKKGDPKSVEAALNQVATTGVLAGIETLAPLPRAQFDGLVHRLALRMGLLSMQNPEQASPTENWRLINSDAKLKEIEAELGIPMAMPGCFGFHHMLMPHRFFFYCSALFTLKGMVPRFGHVLEIGAGLGNLGFISHHMRAESFTVIDLPSVAVMSAWFVSKVCGEDKVWLLGEPPGKDDFARFYPCTQADGVGQKKYTVVFNSDSLPEMPGAVRDGYIELISGCLAPDGVFLSINHESDRAGQDSVLSAVRRNGKLRLAARYPYLMRDGYIEEIYKQNLCTNHIPTAVPAD